MIIKLVFFERYGMVRGKRNRDGRENEGTPVMILIRLYAVWEKITC